MVAAEAQSEDLKLVVPTRWHVATAKAVEW
jgi:hypothetical protein